MPDIIANQNHNKARQSIIKSEVSTFQIVIIFAVVVCLRCLSHHILLLIAYTSREKWEFVFISIVQFMMSANNRIRFVLNIVFVCLYIIIIVQIYLKTSNLWNACQIYFAECVSKIKHILSVIQYTTHGTVCFQFTHFLVIIERIYILCVIIIIKLEVWTITHCLGSGHETMVCAVCLFVFLWRCIKHSVWLFNNFSQSGLL